MSVGTNDPILFLNARQAESGSIENIRLPRAYVMACRFFRCSIIDRTRTLDQGFTYAVLDPIPRLDDNRPTFERLCDETGQNIVAEARATKRDIAVLWSGGIDSTCAVIAIVKAADDQDYRDHVRIVVSMSSVHEYPSFFLSHLVGQIAIQPVTYPIAEFLDPACLNVTGEHGDQLFGSHLLKPYVQRGVAQVDYREILPLVLLERLRSPRAARTVQRFLEPVITSAPVPIRSLFDCMWWLNFALKWQEVSLRLAVFRGTDTKAVFDSFRHFFRDARFQQWALATTCGLPVTTWPQYKSIAKGYIRDFTGDDHYYQTKEKEDSLRNVIGNPSGDSAIHVFMRADFLPVVTVVDQPRSPLVWRLPSMAASGYRALRSRSTQTVSRTTNDHEGGGR
jgi:hypothetical protein